MSKVFSGDFKFSKHFFMLLIGLLTISLLSFTANAQKRDNMTNEEDLIIREVIEIDERMQVFVKIIDRRLFALTDPNAKTSKQAQKDTNNDWGELRTGTIGELFWDIQKTLDEAIGKIDDVAERDQKNPLFGKAVHILSKGCEKWQPQFKTFLDKTADDKDKGLILNSADNCAQIIEASKKVADEVPKDDKKKKKN
jgi:hypothetical protein